MKTIETPKHYMATLLGIEHGYMIYHYKCNSLNIVLNPLVLIHHPMVKDLQVLEVYDQSIYVLS